MTYTNRTQWRRTSMSQCCELCKPFISTLLLIVTYVNDIVNIVTNLNSKVSTNLTTGPTTHITLPNVRHDLQDIKWNESNRKNSNNTNLNERVKNLLKTKVSKSLTRQNSKTYTSKEDCIPSRIYLVTKHFLTVMK